MKTITFHIGYAKTATTFMQEHVYPMLANVNYVGRFVDKFGDERDNLPWVYEFAEKLKLDKDQLLSSLNPSAIQNHLISHEVLMRPYKLDKALELLASLNDKNTKVKVVLSIRNPLNLVFSRYVHDIMTGVFGTYALKDALDYEGTTECIWPMCGNGIVNKLWRKSPFNGGSCLCNKYKLKTINVPYYNLSLMHDKLTTTFGKENVHFLILERLKEEQSKEIDRLCNFLSNEVNTVSINHELLGAPNNSNKRSDLEIYKRLMAENESNGVLTHLEKYFNSANEEFARKTQFAELKPLGYF
jgi:hypothetical protein